MVPGRPARGHNRQQVTVLQPGSGIQDHDAAANVGRLAVNTTKGVKLYIQPLKGTKCLVFDTLQVSGV
jgi:hypothetical protein